MRKLSGVLGVLMLAACGGNELPHLSVDGAPPTTIVRLADPDGISLLDTDAGRITTWIRGGLRSHDWVFQSRLTSTGTSLSAVSPLGEVAWQRELDGDLSARVVSSDGSRVAMLPFEDAPVDLYHPAGRATTHLTVVSTDSGDVNQLELNGNFAPEAFSTSGESLFVIEYLPADAPETYRVRKLNVATGTVGPVYSIDGHLQESMRGTARVQAMSADGTRLYTLYTTMDDGVPRAFVHVLDLEDEWAHCVDLPDPIGWSGEQHLAVAADPSGDRAVVVDDLVAIAEIDAHDLTVTKTVPFTISADNPGRAMAVIDDDGRLLAGRGQTLVALDPTFTETGRWRLEAPMLGAYADPSRAPVVWLLTPDTVLAVDERTGETMRRVTLPETMPALEVPPVQDGEPIQCAC